MGLIDKLLKIFGVKKESAKVVCVGLDNSGKTTLLNKLKKDKEQQVSHSHTFISYKDQFIA